MRKFKTKKVPYPGSAFLGAVLAIFMLFFAGMEAKADDPSVQLNAAAVTLTEENPTFDLYATFETELPDVEWVSSDTSVVDFSSYSYSQSSKKCYAELEAKKNGTASFRLVNKEDGTVYAACQVTCTGMTDYYPVMVAGVEVTNKNCSSITGENISGTVSYDPSTETLYLNNAVLSGSGWYGGSFGGGAGVLIYNGTGTLTVRLTGENVIRNVDVASNPYNKYDASSGYVGAQGLHSDGSFSLKGTGSLTIASGSIGTGIRCRELTVDKGTSLKLEITFGGNSAGISADRVTVNGVVSSKHRTSITSYGISTGELIVGDGAQVQIQTETTGSLTSYAVSLSSGGAARINGRLKAFSYGAEGKAAGLGISGGKNADMPASLEVGSGGVIEAMGNVQAVDNLTYKLAPGVIINVGSSGSDVQTITPETNNAIDARYDITYHYVNIGKGLKVNRRKPEEETEENGASGNDGKTGEDETSSKSGETGDGGTSSKDGNAGEDGATAKSGESGDGGTSSKDGKTGEDGTTAKSGESGDGGTSSKDGDTGKDGTTAKSGESGDGESSGKAQETGSSGKTGNKVSLKKNKVYTVGKFKVKITQIKAGGKGTAAITGAAKGKPKTVKIPDTVKVGGVKFLVTEISAKAFTGNKVLKSVSIGKNVKTIGKNAFSGCVKLKTVSGGKGLVTIGASAFRSCRALTKITLQAKVKKIGKEAFFGCKNLKSIVIKTTLLKKGAVGSKAFKGISSKAVVTCPQSKKKDYKKLLLSCGMGQKVTFR